MNSSSSYETRNKGKSKMKTYTIELSHTNGTYKREIKGYRAALAKAKALAELHLGLVILRKPDGRGKAILA
jgi:hypothetical protein